MKQEPAISSMASEESATQPSDATKSDSNSRQTRSSARLRAQNPTAKAPSDIASSSANALRRPAGKRRQVRLNVEVGEEQRIQSIEDLQLSKEIDEDESNGEEEDDGMPDTPPRHGWERRPMTYEIAAESPVDAGNSVVVEPSRPAIESPESLSHLSPTEFYNRIKANEKLSRIWREAGYGMEAYQPQSPGNEHKYQIVIEQTGNVWKLEDWKVRSAYDDRPSFLWNLHGRDPELAKDIILAAFHRWQKVNDSTKTLVVEHGRAGPIRDNVGESWRKEILDAFVGWLEKGGDGSLAAKMLHPLSR